MVGRWGTALGALALLAACGTSTETGSATDPAVTATAESAVATELADDTTDPESVLRTGDRPTSEIDFDQLYRELDEIRVQAWADNDPVALAGVTSNRADIARVEAEASGSEPAWDRSGITWEIDSVDVFAIVDERNVLLRVVDLTTGFAVRRGESGEVVDEGDEPETPERTWVAWLERLDGDGDEAGGWRIAEDYPVDDEFPVTLDDFEAGPTVEVDGLPLEMWINNHNRGVCWVLRYEDTVPVPNCEEVQIRLAGGTARFDYHLERSERYEAFVVVTRKTSSFQLQVLVDGNEVSFDQELSADRVAALWADLPDRASELVIGAIDDAGALQPNDFVLADARQEQRDDHAGIRN